MIIRNASVYTEDGIFIEKDIYIADEIGRASCRERV